MFLETSSKRVPVDSPHFLFLLHGEYKWILRLHIPESAISTLTVRCQQLFYSPCICLQITNWYLIRTKAGLSVPTYVRHLTSSYTFNILHIIFLPPKSLLFIQSQFHYTLLHPCPFLLMHLRFRQILIDNTLNRLLICPELKTCSERKKGAKQYPLSGLLFSPFCRLNIKFNG